MTHALSWTDRLCIERAIWTLDGRLQDLPRRSRVANRREVRANLHAAAADIGTVEALHQLGDPRRLAADYLAAEYGEWGRRPSWLAGFSFLVAAYLLLTWLLDTGTSAFRSGVTSADPNANGIFQWHGVPPLLDDVTFTFVAGKSTAVGGAWTPLVYVLLATGVVLVGRLWRLLPAWRRRRPPTTNDH